MRNDNKIDDKQLQEKEKKVVNPIEYYKAITAAVEKNKKPGIVDVDAKKNVRPLLHVNEDVLKHRATQPKDKGRLK